MASENGKVIFDGYIRGYGKTLMIMHKKKLVTIYSSRDMISIAKKGEEVKLGEVIGYMDQKNSRGALLFHIWSNGNLEDPRSYLSRDSLK